MYYILFFIAASLDVGNTLPIGRIPEGTAVCNLEEKYGDRGRLARCSGLAAQVKKGFALTTPVSGY